MKYKNRLIGDLVRISHRLLRALGGLCLRALSTKHLRSF